MSETKAQTMRRLFNDNGLVQEDVYVMEKFDKRSGETKRIPIITRSGIEKIQSKRNIEITYEVEAIDLALNSCAIRAIGVMRSKDGKIESHIQTFGSASPNNTNITQTVEVAEKRARARAVLMLAGFYQEGYHSEDENLDA
jgi:hypothetical protein